MYNGGMKNDNLNNFEGAGVEGVKNEMVREKATERKKSSNIGMYIGLGLAGVVAVAVAATAIVMNLSKNDSSGSYATVTLDDGTELKSGSVTTTIGGKSVTYTAAYVVDGVEATISSGAYESAADDENVFLVINGGSLKINGEVTINKTGSEDFAGRGDNYSFYGLNSAIVVVGEGSSASLEGVTIETDVSGANAIVATNGGEVVIRGSSIATSKDNSRGLHATYGGVINADNVTIATKGGSCAALATDRGTGTVVADNMKLSTEGAGSPLIYSTGEITVTNSTGTATGAQIAVVEGKNSINLQGCEFSANGIGNRGNVDNAGVMIYQSMSGDADEGEGEFTATDCTLTVLESSSVYNETPFFFVTNTTASIDLTSSTISFSPSAKLVSALGTDEWGRAGSNGGDVDLDMSGVQATNTEVEVDSISQVEI